MRRMTCHLPNKQQRSVPQLHHNPRLDGQSRNLRSLDLPDQFANASGNRYAILVEFILPKHARQHTPA
jgi:hypothetical protein